MDDENSTALASHRKSISWDALAVCIGIVFAGLLITTARRTSLVYDEVIYAPAGVMIWETGDYRWNIEHPPLQKLIAALPLLARRISIPNDLNPSQTDAWHMGYRVFFSSEGPATRLINLARAPTTFLSLMLGGLLFMTVRKAIGAEAATASLCMFAFDPLVLSNGALAMNDMFVTFFLFASVLALNVSTDRLALPAVIASAFLAGWAIASKFSGVLILPILIFLSWLRRSSFRTWLTHALAQVIIAFVVLLICYRFKLSVILEAFQKGFAFHKGDNGMGYLLGPVSGAVGWYYYPVAFLIKTPIPLLCLWLGGIIFLLRSKSRKDWIFFPIAIFWLAVVTSHNHFGLRYLLPATPFLAVAAGFLFEKNRPALERRFCWALVVWLAAEALISHPYHMAYFNEFVGGSENGYKWLDGSNQDWGQDLPSLVELIRKQSTQPTVCMGYWGSNRPEAWGLEYQDVLSPAITNSFRRDTVNPVETPSEWLVVSAELVHNPATREVYGWLRTKTPIHFVGSTLFVYDITRDLESVRKLGSIYERMGRTTLFERQLARERLIQAYERP